MLNIFDASNFMPRYMCINRDSLLAFLYVLPNLGIFLTYSIGFAYIWNVLRHKASFRKITFLPTLLGLMVVFFVFCGGTHFNDAIAMVWPAYWFFAIWEWIQFVVAFYAFIYAINIIKKFVP